MPTLSTEVYATGQRCCQHAARVLTHFASLLFCCRCIRSDNTPRQVLPYDNTRDQDVSLRELYGETQDDTVKVTWVTGDASSETSSNLEVPSDAASEHFHDAEQSLVTRMQSKDYEQLGSLRELHAAADLAKHTPEKTPMALGSTPGQTSLQQQDPVHEGIGTLVQRQADADLQEQVNVLETEKEDLQDKVAALQRQLTWLQSHASLQDNINKDLMEEVLHLRQAMASLSAVPPAESKSGKDTLAHHK